MLPLLLSACSAPAGPDAPAPPPSALPWPTADGPVWTSVVVTVREPVPARFDAAPTSVVEDVPEALPVDALAHRLCRGTRDARTLARTRLEPVVGWSALSAVDCDDPGFCAWLADTLEPMGRDDRVPWWPAVLGCAEPRLDRLVAEEGPTGIVLAAAPDRPLPWSPHLATLADGLEDDADRRAQVAGLWLSVDTPEAHAALRALHRGHPELPDPGDRSVLQLLPDAFDQGVDPLVLAERFPGQREALAQGLEACLRTAADRDPFQVRRCARGLARLDPARAGLAVDRTEDVYGVLTDVLSAPPDEVRRQLAELGLSDAGGPAGSATTVGEVLAAMGHAVVLRFSSRGGEASLAYRVADLVGLSDAEFEVVHADGRGVFDEGRVPRSALFAWSGARRWRTLLQDVADIPHTLGLINALLADAGRTERVALDRSRTTVVAATPAQLEALARAGWVTWAELGDLLEAP